MKDKCAFTICAKNYIGLAETLKKSICKFSSDLDFFIIVADELDGQVSSVGTDIIEYKKIAPEDFNISQIAFKYNITEYCTCLKPFSFEYLISKGYQKICYFDPDILFFDTIEKIYERLEQYSIVLTPHFVSFPRTKESKRFEDEVKFSGIYNLGFLGLANNSKTQEMLSWWAENLKEKCYSDIHSFQFTDQKWMDFMPVFYSQDELLIEKSLGWNIAPWNYFEREVFLTDGKFFVKSRISNKIENQYQLLFCHYSGYDYRLLLDNKVIQNNDGHENVFPDIRELLDYYKNILLENETLIKKYLNLSYSYNYFNNGIVITNFDRRIYRAYLELHADQTSPFSENGEFYHLLKSNKLLSKKNVDNEIKVVRKNETYIVSKLRKANILFSFIAKVLGKNRYNILIRFLHKYTILENQVFLINKNFIRWN